MGGIGSGRRREVHPASVEDLPVIDIRVLRRLGLLRPGECVIDTLRWSRGGLEVAEARIRIDLSTPDTALMVVATTHHGKTLRQSIDIETIACRFGGHRLYLRCPRQGRRSETIYLLNGRWGSRQAHRLAYATQSMAALPRARKRRRALFARLKGQGPTPKPRGRHRYDVAQRLAQTRRQERALFSEAVQNHLDCLD
jgi:hypothetical protein